MGSGVVLAVLPLVVVVPLLAKLLLAVAGAAAVAVSGVDGVVAAVLVDGVAVAV